MGHVALLPGSGGGVLAGGTAVQLALESGRVQRQTRRDAGEGHADDRAVGFAKNHVPHVSFPPSR